MYLHKHMDATNHEIVTNEQLPNDIIPEAKSFHSNAPQQIG